MIIHINDNRMLRELQLDLSRYYPYLRMEFYSSDKIAQNHSSSLIKLDPYLKTGSVRTQHHAGVIHILPGTTIKAFKEKMKNDFNLCIQLLQFTKEGWVSSDNLENFSLDELNEQGRNIFHDFNNVGGQLKNLF